MTSSELPPEGRFNPCYIPAGTLIGKYEILTGIGRGGGQMAYLARDPNWNQVVVKVGLSPRDETGTWNRVRLERFIRQVQYFLQLAMSGGRPHPRAGCTRTTRARLPVPGARWVWMASTSSTGFGEPQPLEVLVRAWMYLADDAGRWRREASATGT
jgi:hypothetical protein